MSHKTQRKKPRQKEYIAINTALDDFKNQNNDNYITEMIDLKLFNGKYHWKTYLISFITLMYWLFVIVLISNSERSWLNLLCWLLLFSVGMCFIILPIICIGSPQNGVRKSKIEYNINIACYFLTISTFAYGIIMSVTVIHLTISWIFIISTILITIGIIPYYYISYKYEHQRCISNNSDPFKYLQHEFKANNYIDITLSTQDRTYKENKYIIKTIFHCYINSQFADIDKNKYYMNKENITMIEFNVKFQPILFSNNIQKELNEYIENAKVSPSQNVTHFKGNAVIQTQTKICLKNFDSSYSNIHQSNYSRRLDIPQKKIIMLFRSNKNCCFYGLRSWVCGFIALPSNLALWLNLCNRMEKQICLRYDIDIYHKIQFREDIVINGFIHELENKTQHILSLDVMKILKQFLKDYRLDQPKVFVYQLPDDGGF